MEFTKTKYNIIFDWGGVLGENNNRYAARLISQKYKLNEEELFVELDTLEGDFAYVINDMDTANYYLYFQQKYGIPSEELKKALNSAPPNDTFNFVRNLAKSGHNLYLLSNQLYSRSEALKHDNDLSFFRGVFFSSDIGLDKPDPQVYQFLLRQIEAEPEDCIFVDDRKTNIFAAEQCGMHTILFRNQAQLQEALAEFGVTQ